MERNKGMRRILGVLLAIVMVCIPMRIEAYDFAYSFDYTGQRIEVEDAYQYYSTEFELLDETPSDCGTYIAITPKGAVYYEIKPRDVLVSVSYNKEYRYGQPEEKKYLCAYDEDLDFKLIVKDNGDFDALNSYNGNYNFVFSPSNVRDIKQEKIRITHEDVECVYNEKGTLIYSSFDDVKPIELMDVGEYVVSFDVDERYYESVPFKVVIVAKTVQLDLPKFTKVEGQKDPNFDYEDYVLVREPGEGVGDYKLSVKSKSDNYRYELIGGDVFTILDYREGEGIKQPYIKKEDKEKEKPKSNVPTGVFVNESLNWILLCMSLVGVVFIKKKMKA